MQDSRQNLAADVIEDTAHTLRLQQRPYREDPRFAWSLPSNRLSDIYDTFQWFDVWPRSSSTNHDSQRDLFCNERLLGHCTTTGA